MTGSNGSTNGGGNGEFPGHGKGNGHAMPPEEIGKLRRDLPLERYETKISELAGLKPLAFELARG